LVRVRGFRSTINPSSNLGLQNLIPRPPPPPLFPSGLSTFLSCPFIYPFSLEEVLPPPRTSYVKVLSTLVPLSFFSSFLLSPTAEFFFFSSPQRSSAACCAQASAQGFISYPPLFPSNACHSITSLLFSLFSLATCLRRNDTPLPLFFPPSLPFQLENVFPTHVPLPLGPFLSIFRVFFSDSLS